MLHIDRYCVVIGSYFQVFSTWPLCFLSYIFIDIYILRPHNLSFSILTQGRNFSFFHVVLNIKGQTQLSSLITWSISTNDISPPLLCIFCCCFLDKFDLTDSAMHDIVLQFNYQEEHTDVDSEICSVPFSCSDIVTLGSIRFLLVAMLNDVLRSV